VCAHVFSALGDDLAQAVELLLGVGVLDPVHEHLEGDVVAVREFECAFGGFEVFEEEAVALDIVGEGVGGGGVEGLRVGEVGSLGFVEVGRLKDEG
jgi:hypothetical protein